MGNIKEGSLYKTLAVEGRTFDIYYGYYSDCERELWPPAPIYPDFVSSPEYTAEGYPFARADGDVCEHYLPKAKASGENWCNDCKHFKSGDELIGVCRCQNKKTHTS